MSLISGSCTNSHGWCIASKNFLFHRHSSRTQQSHSNHRTFFNYILDLVVFVNNKDFAGNLIATGSKRNIQLAKHVIFDGDTNKIVRVKRLDNQALFVKIVSERYIGEIDNITDPQYRLRLMKSCIYNHYTTVILEKYSMYTQHVNERIRWYYMK